MHDYGVALGIRLTGQRGHLGYLAEEERDLHRAMRLSDRLASVERNIGHAERRVETLRAELLRRASDARG